jgi:hypothetical protein
MIEARPVSAAYELGRPAIAVIVSPRPDFDAVSDQDAPDAGGCAAAQNAEIIQAGTVAIALGQLLRRDGDRDRRPWIPLNHLPVPTACPPRQQYAGAGSGCWLICATIRSVALRRAEADHAKADQVCMAQDVATMFDELRALADRHADHATELERVRDQLDRARQDAGLWREEADRERARIANLQVDAEHTEREMARLRAELEQAQQPWWRRVIGR